MTKNALPEVRRCSVWAASSAAPSRPLAGRDAGQLGDRLGAQARQLEARDVGLAVQVGQQLGQRVFVVELGRAERRDQRQAQPHSAPTRWRTSSSVGVSAHWMSSSNSTTGRWACSAASRPATAPKSR